MIIIIDYGMGNLRSVQKAFERTKVRACISSDFSEISKASKLVLPGVGHFEQGMKSLQARGLKSVLQKVVLENKIPILGICLGMQLMTNFSEEGGVEGLGWINAQTRKFIFSDNNLKIPHMGWNTLITRNGCPLLHNIAPTQFYYFVHSYYILCNIEQNVAAETIYGANFVSVFNNGNIYGCQFHPEKSHDAGLQVLKNFTDLT